ncbi:MAG: chemotaxis protein CheB [Planctomycetota bacterium]
MSEHPKDEAGPVGACTSVVAVGASAGGLAPIERFFGSMPPGSGAAFVVIQHLSPDFKSLMKELLSSHTSFPVHRVEEGMELRADNVYLIPPKTNMTMTADRKLRLAEQDRDGHRVSFPIDRFFESMAEHMGSGGIGVILSGTGSDGTRGARAIDESGGVVMAEDPADAQFDGMPRSVLATGVVRFSQPADELASTVYALLKRTDSSGDWRIDASDDAQHAIVSEAIALLGASTNVDFTHYRPETIARRLARRVAMTASPGPAAYLKMLASDPSEQVALRDDILIGVTGFFRDRDAWDALAKDVIPKLFDRASEEEPVRVWVSACATGEEAYTMAILLAEERRRRKSNVPIRLFATDIDKRSLDRATLGDFAESVLEPISPELLDRYFVRHEGGFRVTRELRELVIFAEQNLTRDAPFTRLDLVACRNVLIYMQPHLQERVIATLLYALKHEGVLLLGSAESVGELAGDVEVVNSRWKTYRKIRDTQSPAVASSSLHARRPGGEEREAVFRPRGRSDGRAFERFHADAMRLVLDDADSACLVVDSSNRLVHVYFGGQRYLRVPDGRATDDIADLVLAELAVPLSTAIHRARKDEQRISYSSIAVKDADGGERLVDLRVLSSRRGETSGGAGPLIVVIAPSRRAPIERVTGSVIDGHAQERIEDLERDLQLTRENLQATIEELETTNEEQQATNEELLASNEQLQSTNEELQSVNEELHTVNAEHQSKISQLTELHADVEHLLMSTRIGMVFLDGQMRIRKFTPTATSVLRLSPIDIGRSVSDLASNLEGDPNALLELLDRVNRTGESEDLPARTRAGRSVRLRANPYLGSSGERAGVVLAVIDVTTLQFTQDALRQTNNELEELISTISHDLKTPIVTIASFAELLERSIGDPDPRRRADYAARIRSAAMRSQKSIDDMLGYRRISRELPIDERVDLDSVVREAVETLGGPISERRATVSVLGELPAVRGNGERISVAIENLVMNALHHSGLDEGEQTPRAITQGACLVPKYCMDVMKCEIDRLLQLHSNGIHPISYHVSRTVSRDPISLR